MNGTDGTDDSHHPDLQSLDRALDEMAAATDRLLRSVDGLTEEDLAGPSLLPGWTRAHVLTHLARNADGFVNLVHAARTGEEREMYEGGKAGREAGIEAGLGRHLGDVRLDLSDSAERLLEAFAGFPAEGLAREVTMTSGASAYGWEIPFLRVREVEIHHVDLDAGYTPDDWDPEFATRTLDQLAPFFRSQRDCPVGVLGGDRRRRAVGGGRRGSHRDRTAVRAGRLAHRPYAGTAG